MKQTHKEQQKCKISCISELANILWEYMQAIFSFNT